MKKQEFLLHTNIQNEGEASDFAAIPSNFKCSGMCPFKKKKSRKEKFPLIFCNILKVLEQINRNEAKIKSLHSQKTPIRRHTESVY